MTLSRKEIPLPSWGSEWSPRKEVLTSLDFRGWEVTEIWLHLRNLTGWISRFFFFFLTNKLKHREHTKKCHEDIWLFSCAPVCDLQKWPPNLCVTCPLVNKRPMGALLWDRCFLLRNPCPGVGLAEPVCPLSAGWWAYRPWEENPFPWKKSFLSFSLVWRKQGQPGKPAQEIISDQGLFFPLEGGGGPVRGSSPRH